MRALPAVAAATFILAVPSGALAQDTAPPEDPPAEAPVSETASGEEALAEISDKLADPDFQDQITAVAGVLVNTMLDLEIGQFVQAVDQASNGGAGPEDADIDADTRVRDLMRNPDDLSEDIEENLPQAMNTMSAMSEGFAAMLPALEAMAKQMGDAVARARTAD